MEKKPIAIACLCENALISVPQDVGDFQILPMETDQISHLADLLVRFSGTYKISVCPRDYMVTLLTAQKHRLRPRFALYWKSVDLALYDAKGLTQFWNSDIKRALGTVALVRNAYPEPNLVVCWHFDKGQFEIRMDIWDGYYKGNILCGPIAGESASKIAEILTPAKQDRFVQELLEKYRLAHKENDLDVAYFRYWSIIEAITYHCRNSIEYNDVKTLIRDVIAIQKMRSLEKVVIEGATFNTDQLIAVWYAARNIAAHFGGMYMAREKNVKIQGDLKRLIRAVEGAGRMYAMGEDSVFLFLKDVVEAAIKALCRGELHARTTKP